ncbi:MAG: hypothetical protein RPR40_05245 [Bermanella sp.]|jgi:hypothetical protein
MSRRKKSRSLKNNHSGLKTGSKERTKLESKQRKAAKKVANPRKVSRQRSVYQQHMDKSGLVEIQHVDAPKPSPIRPIVKKLSTQPPKQAPMAKPAIASAVATEVTAVDLWDQLESPQNADIF